MATAKADFQRNADGQGITYSVRSASLGAFFFIIELPVLFAVFLTMGIIAGYGFSRLLGGLLTGGRGEPGALASFLMFLVFIGAAACVLYLGYRIVRGKLGTRQARRIVVSSRDIAVYKPGSGAVVASVERSSVRRLRIGNTGTKPAETPSTVYLIGSGGLGNPVTAVRVGSRHGANSFRAKHLHGVSFTLQLDHANESVVLADGLDEFTAINLMQDIGRDIQPA